MLHCAYVENVFDLTKIQLVQYTFRAHTASRYTHDFSATDFELCALRSIQFQQLMDNIFNLCLGICVPNTDPRFQSRKYW